MKTPNLKPRKMDLELGYANRLLGMSFSAPEAKALLEKMRYGVEAKGGKITVLVPPYRTDVLHPIDLVEDIAIAYGYNRFAPELPKLSTTGARDVLETFAGSVRDLLVGFGFQEIMTLTMTGEKELFEKMNAPTEEVVSTKNPVSEDHSVVRNWLMPSLVSVLAKNTSREYPQKIFEIGYCLLGDGKQKRKISGAITHAKTSFSEMKAVVSGLLECLGVEHEVSAAEHPSFIPGRCASTRFGLFGELHPQVLENFGLEVPVTAFELDLDELFKARK